MRQFKLFSFTMLGLLGFMLAACSPKPGIVYGAPIDKVYDILRMADLPKGLRMTFDQPRDPEISQDGSNVRTITWDGELNISKLKITMTPEGDNTTRVLVEVIPDPKVADATSPQMTAMDQAMADEFVDSTLSNRPYDEKAVTNKMAAWVLAHMSEIQSEGVKAAMQASSNTTSPEMQELMRRESASMPSGGYSAPIDGSPTMNPTASGSSDSSPSTMGSPTMNTNPASQNGMNGSTQNSPPSQ